VDSKLIRPLASGRALKYQRQLAFVCRVAPSEARPELPQLRSRRPILEATRPKPFHPQIAQSEPFLSHFLASVGARTFTSIRTARDAPSLGSEENCRASHLKCR
jgi:hypothetical protein